MMRHVTKHLRHYKLLKDNIGPPSATLHSLNCPQFVTTQPNLTFSCIKNLHLSSRKNDKIFVSTENAYAYNLLPEISKLIPTWKPPKQIKTLQEFEQFLDKNWRASRASEIVEAFEHLKHFCIEHNINLSDKRFDKLVDGLMDHCEKLTDEELLKLLHLLVEYPPCESSTSHNFHDVWSCLDDICCWKMGAWNHETMFTFAEAWYTLNLGRLSDYVHEALDKITSKPHRLSKEMLIYTFFYLNVCRKKQIPFDIEHVVAARIDEFNIDELAIIAMGYFKTRSKIKLKEILSAMIEAVKDNCNTLNEISLTAMLKTIRLSQNFLTTDQIPPMLDNLVDRIPSLSNMSLVHIALTGTSLQIKHEATLIRCAEKIAKDIEIARLKDIERMILACSMFNVDTDPSIFELAFEEIQKETRRKEFAQYNRCLVSTLHYLSQRKFYSYKLMDEVLNEEYINEIYGKSPKNVPRELFSIDAGIEIECPDYTGNRLNPVKKYKAAKWLCDYVPTEDQHRRLSTSDKFYLDIAEHVAAIAGGERFVQHYHILPHFCRADIIVCKDKTTGHFVEPFGFDNYVLGDVMRPSETEKYKWFAVVALPPNLTIKDRIEPLGSMVMKKRQLEAIGFTPVFIYWNQYTDFSTSQKTGLLSEKLS